MQKEITIITVIEGGTIQNIYSPDPTLDLHWINLDYDILENADDDLEEELLLLIQKLRTVDALERSYSDHSTVAETLQEMCQKLMERLRREIDSSP